MYYLYKHSIKSHYAYIYFLEINKIRNDKNFVKYDGFKYHNNKYYGAVLYKITNSLDRFYTNLQLNWIEYK